MLCQGMLLFGQNVSVGALPLGALCQTHLPMEKHNGCHPAQCAT